MIRVCEWFASPAVEQVVTHRDFMETFLSHAYITTITQAFKHYHTRLQQANTHVKSEMRTGLEPMLETKVWKEQIRTLSNIHIVSSLLLTLVTSQQVNTLSPLSPLTLNLIHKRILMTDSRLWFVFVSVGWCPQVSARFGS